MGTKNLQINSPELLADPSAERAELGLSGNSRANSIWKTDLYEQNLQGAPSAGETGFELTSF